MSEIKGQVTNNNDNDDNILLLRIINYLLFVLLYFIYYFIYYFITECVDVVFTYMFF